MADNTFNGYQEYIERFDFTTSGSLRIPKPVRKKAYSFSLDIEIKSIIKDAYRNYKSVPAHSFYGYAIIVLRDYSEIKIPIENSRQRLFTDRISEAYANWYALYLNYIQAIYHTANNAYLAQIGSVLLIPPNPSQASCPIAPPWQEIELREIYIKCPHGTRFSLEMAWIEPISNTFGACVYDGNSQQIDDEFKDDGLPPKTAPAVAPSAAYPANEQPSGNWINAKNLSGMDDMNPENTPSDIGYYAKISYEVKYNQFDCVRVRFTQHFLLNSGDNLSLVVGGQDVLQCDNIIHRSHTVSGSVSGMIFSQNVIPSSLTFEKVEAYSKPNDSVVAV